MALRSLSLLLTLFIACAPSRPAPRASFHPVAQFQSDNAVEIGPIGDMSLVRVMAALRGAPAHVVFKIDSPGGYVGAGLRMVDAMKYAQSQGTHITCVVDGMAASMAGYILMACDRRYMTRQSSLMFHTVSVGGVDGNAWDFERLAKRMKELNKMLAIFIAGRMKIPLAEYEAKTHDADWWVGYEEALEIGAIDGVL